MAGRLLERVKKLEARFQPKPPPAPYIIEIRVGESEDEAARRYFARWGRRPGPKPYLIMAPAMLSREQWRAVYGDSGDDDTVVGVEGGR